MELLISLSLKISSCFLLLAAIVSLADTYALLDTNKISTSFVCNFYPESRYQLDRDFEPRLSLFLPTAATLQVKETVSSKTGFSL